MEEIKINAQRLEAINKGTNFLNLNNEYGKKKYYIKVFLEVDRNLESEKEGLDVSHNLPFSGGYWRSGESVETFFKELKKYISRPFGKVIIQNEGTKRAEISGYSVNQIGYKIRDTEISFEDIDFTIGELAENKLKEEGIDFEKDVKKILSGQVITNRQKDVDNYVRLKTKIENLKKLLCKESNYGYGYREEKDETIKMPLTAEEYNSKLKEVETELRTLEKEFGLREDKLDYIEVKTEEQQAGGFDKWFKDNEEQLREDFEDNQQEEESETTFDEYVDMCYENRDESEE